jgi:ribosomal protein S18 acetylase RimI-like enzyme
MKIETFSIDSYDDIISIWRKTGVSVGSTDTKDEIKRILDKNPQLFLVGKIEQKIISVVIGGFDGRRGYVHHLAVDPDYQKRGYGKKIMDELNVRFRKMGVHKVHLFIEKDNKEVVSFYLNLGWEIRDDLIMMSYIPDKNLYKTRI